MGYKTREWRNSMRVTLDYNNMTDKFLGDKGFTSKKLSSYNSKAMAAFNYVKANRGKDELYMGWTELPYNQKEIVADIQATAKEISAAAPSALSWHSTHFATCIITTYLNSRERALNSTSKTT